MRRRKWKTPVADTVLVLTPVAVIAAFVGYHIFG
jgi:hypothetical protein